jgi:hypothetical protein
MRLTIPNRVEGAAGQAVNPCHRHHVAGGQLAEHPVKLTPVGPRACHLLAVYIPAAASRRPKLLKLRRYVVGEGWSDWHDATAPSRAMRGTNAPAVFSSATAIPYTCLTAAGGAHEEGRACQIGSTPT